MIIPNESQQNFNIFIAIIIVIFLSLLEYRLVILLHADDLKNLFHAAYGVTIGEPHWRVYQNRLLGPFSVKGLSEILGMTYAQVYMFFTMGLLVIQNVLFFALFRQLTDDNRLSVRYTLYFVAFFIALSDSNWLYLWDFLDIIVFTLFIYGILAYKNNWYFLFVFGIAILNKESGLFIALWLILDALIEKRDTNSFYFAMKLRDLKRLFLGIALLVGGIFFVEWIRDALFIKSAAGGGVKFTGIEYGKYVHFKFLINLKVFVYNLTNLNFLLNFLVNIFILALPLFVIIQSKKAEETIFKIIILFLAIYSTIMLFGVLNETRVYNILIPFIIFLSAYFSGHIVPRKMVSS